MLELQQPWARAVGSLTKLSAQDNLDNACQQGDQLVTPALESTELCQILFTAALSETSVKLLLLCRAQQTIAVSNLGTGCLFLSISLVL